MQRALSSVLSGGLGGSLLANVLPAASRILGGSQSFHSGFPCLQSDAVKVSTYMDPYLDVGTWIKVKI